MLPGRHEKEMGQRSNLPLAANAGAPRQSKAPSIHSLMLHGPELHAIAAPIIAAAKSAGPSSLDDLETTHVPTDAAQCQARRRANRRCRSAAKPQPALRSGTLAGEQRSSSPRCRLSRAIGAAFNQGGIILARDRHLCHVGFDIRLLEGTENRRVNRPLVAYTWLFMAVAPVGIRLRSCLGTQAHCPCGRRARRRRRRLVENWSTCGLAAIATTATATTKMIVPTLCADLPIVVTPLRFKRHKQKIAAIPRRPRSCSGRCQSCEPSRLRCALHL
jgi:hypothetical protein